MTAVNTKNTGVTGFKGRIAGSFSWYQRWTSGRTWHWFGNRPGCCRCAAKFGSMNIEGSCRCEAVVCASTTVERQKWQTVIKLLYCLYILMSPLFHLAEDVLVRNGCLGWKPIHTYFVAIQKRCMNWPLFRSYNELPSFVIISAITFKILKLHQEQFMQ